MITFLTIIFVLVCGILMLAILLQSGKGGGLSGTFGGTSEFVGGRSAATFLTKATTTLAATFMIMAIVLSTLATRARHIEEQTEVQQRMQELPAAAQQMTPLPTQGEQNESAPAETP